MINSKALSSSKDNVLDLILNRVDRLKYPRLHAALWWLTFNVYYTFTGFVKNSYHKIKKSFVYAKYGWTNYDFDYAYVWDIMYFKLKRLYKCLENDIAVQEEKDMKALKELTKIVFRLRMDSHDRKYHHAHDRKWGKLQIGNFEGRSMSRSGTQNASEKLKKQERKEFLKCWENGNKDREKDLDRMNAILKKHSRSWWS